MRDSADLSWILITVCVLLFWDGTLGIDLHTAIVHHLTGASYEHLLHQP